MAEDDFTADVPSRPTGLMVVDDDGGPEDGGQVDYFGFSETREIMLPDGKSWLKQKIWTEGDRKRFQNKTQRDVRLQKGSGDAIVRMAAGEERWDLITTAITDWNLVKQGKRVPFNDSNLKKFLEATSPKIVDLIEKEIRKANPWLLSDMSLEDIDREIAQLQELREEKVKEEEGKEG